MITLSGIQLGLFIGGGIILGAIIGIVSFIKTVDNIIKSEDI